MKDKYYIWETGKEVKKEYFQSFPEAKIALTKAIINGAEGGIILQCIAVATAQRISVMDDIYPKAGPK